MPGTCWIKDGALADLLAEARRWPLRETGGALLGRRETERTVVEVVLGPGPDAVHGLSHFEPDAAWQQEQGERIYAESGRTIAYLGEWHTHPRGGALPSEQDRRTAREIASEEGFRAPRPLYAIAAKRWHRLGERRWRLRVLELVGGELVEATLLRLPE
jgi:integrative and conjugative element protein (TIGR02256 family)